MQKNSLDIPNVDRILKKEVLDFGFLSSSSLEDLEEGMEKLVRQSTKLNLSICLALHKISSEGLFKEYGHKNFYTYLKKQTIFPYSTAREYAYIGQNFIKLRNMLSENILNENLGKLKFLPKNFDEFKDKEKQEVFKHIKDDSSRGFKLFISSIKGENNDRPLKVKELSLQDILFNFLTKEAKALKKQEIEKLSEGFMLQLQKTKKEGLKIRI